MAEPNGPPRALLVTRNLPPLVGGMERLNLRVALALARDYDLLACGPRGCTTYLQGAKVVREVPSRLPWFIPASAVRTLMLGLRHRPAIVAAGSGLVAPVAWLCARLCGARSVAYLHGLDLVASNRIYQQMWVSTFRRLDVVLVNSRNTQQLAVSRGIPASKVHVLHPGTELPGPDRIAGERFRALVRLGSRPLLLSVGRLTRRKGLSSFVRNVFPKILKDFPEAVLVIIGSDASDAALRDPTSERARIDTAISDAGVGDAVRFLAHCDDSTLHDAYCAANVHVFPVQDLPGDVEGFGMVAIEAAAHGLPTVAFAVGGVPDAVVDGVTGALISAGDYAAFADAVGRILWSPMTTEELEACVASAARFSWESFSDRLLGLVGNDREATA